MARPRTASNILELKGSFAKNPDRGRAREGEMEAFGQVGEAPDYLSESEALCWDELKGDLPDGALSQSDRSHLAMVSKLLAYAKVTPVQDIPAQMMSRLMAGLGLMGMTPADRSKVKIPKKAAVNPFNDI